MENRFGVKDLFLMGLMVLVIVLVVFSMIQFDRQYTQVIDIKRQQGEIVDDLTALKRQQGQTINDLIDTRDKLSRDLEAVRKQLSAGVTVNPGATAGGSDDTAPDSTAGGAPADNDGLTDTTPDITAFTRIEEAAKLPGFAVGDWFVDNFGTKVGKLTPLHSTDVYQRYVENLVMESMASRDPITLKYVPRVARRWEESPDGLKVRFYLHRNVVFSDGRPLTADDVVFTFEMIRNPEIRADRSRAYLTFLDEVKKIDDYTVEVTFKEPYYLNFETIAGQPILAKHFYGQYTPNQFNESVGLLLGSGPYQLPNPTTWTPGTPVVLERNRRYWGPRPTFDQIRFHEVQEEAAQMVLYGNQEHDSIFCTPEMYDRLIADQRIMSFSNALKYDSPYRGYSYIGWNQSRAGKPTVFADKRVRQAMTMLIDRERMVREIFRGYGSVATGPFSPLSPQSNKEIQPHPYNVAEARRLLAEAGFIDRNGDGIIDGPDGQPFRFKLLYPGGSDIYEKLVLFMRDGFAQGGIVMEPDRQDWPVLVERLNKSDFDACTLGWSGSIESDPYQIFHSAQIDGEGDNRTSYRSATLDKLIEQARQTVDVDERMKLWQQVHAVLHEDQPYTFLMNRPYLRLMHKRFHNVEPAPIGLNFEYLNGGMIPWFVPSDQQKYQQ